MRQAEFDEREAFASPTIGQHAFRPRTLLTSQRHCRLVPSFPTFDEPRMGNLIFSLYEDWLWLDERIETVNREIEEISQKEANWRGLMSVPVSAR